MRLRQLTACLAGFLGLACHAADSTGNFSIRGAGLLTCDIYLSERAGQSEAYLMIGGWIDGYITGANQYSPDTYDVTSFESTELLAAIIGNHCEENPDDRLYSVLNSIVAAIHDDRTLQSSPTLVIQSGERETRLYRNTVETIQNALRTRGDYDGEITGLWDEATSRALRAFQEDAGLRSSGFPDQTTLWRLLRSE